MLFFSLFAIAGLDPKYVDVVVRRWQHLTGKKAALDGSGRTLRP